jgi:orotidine-5'-phosphate decarboxylase
LNKFSKVLPTLEGSLMSTISFVEAQPRDVIAFAVDFPSTQEATPCTTAVLPWVGVLKLGLEIFAHEGPGAIAWANKLNRRVFLDLKLHDIPATVARTVRNLCKHQIDFLTLHAQGGPAMIREAREAAADADHPPLMLAVTVLTSLDHQDTQALGFPKDLEPSSLALHLARMAWAEGIHGFVCSAHEVARFRKEFPEAFLVTPGIRPALEGAGGTSGSDLQPSDQKRISTPVQAIADGSNLLVVGRPLRDAANPAIAAENLCQSLNQL